MNVGNDGYVARDAFGSMRAYYMLVTQENESQ